MKYKGECENCSICGAFDECYDNDVEICDNWELSLNDFIEIGEDNQDNELVKDFIYNDYTKYTMADFIKEMFS